MVKMSIGEHRNIVSTDIKQTVN